MKRLLLLIAIVAGTQGSFGEQPGPDSGHNGDIARECELYQLLGRKKGDEAVRKFLESYGFKLSWSRKEDLYDLEPGFKVAGRRKTIETVGYLSHSPPIELTFERTVLPGAPIPDHSLTLARLGYPIGSDNYILAILKSKEPGSIRKKSDKETLPSEFTNGKTFYPFGIAPLMSKDDVVKLLDRPYFAKVVNLDGSRTGSIDFSSDGPGSPFPVKIWLHQGKVCGVDMKRGN